MWSIFCYERKNIKRFWEGPFSSKRACGVVLNRANSIEYRLSPIRRRRIGGEQVIKAEQRLGDKRVVKNKLFAALPQMSRRHSAETALRRRR